MRIDRITLSSLLPRVFMQEELPCSEVWRSEVAFSRGFAYLVEAASGGGKSSLAAFMTGVRSDYEGSVRFNDEDIRGFSITRWQEIRRSHIAYLPQELGLFPELSAIDNIILKAELTGEPDMDKILAWMHRLGIGNRRDFPAGRLSVGQQQRVAIIRSLCQPFDFLLLDEPVSHLDEDNNRIAAAIVEEEAARQSAGIITFSVGNPLLVQNPEKLRL